MTPTFLPLISRLSFAICFACLLGVSHLQAQLETAINDYLQEVSQTHEVPGMAVAVVKGDQVLYENYFGLAELNHEVPVSEQTVFRVYSTTKVLVSVAIFQLAEMGKLSVDDPIKKYLPNLPAGWGDRKIKDLLAHSSGLPDFKFFDGELSEKEMMEKVTQEPIDFPVGERYQYNQTNYWFLANIIEHVSEMPMEDFIRDHQLGGKSGGFVFSSNAHLVFPHRTGAYRRTPTGWVSSGDEAGRYGHAANGLAISLPRFIEWSKRLNQGKLLGEDQLDRLLSPYSFSGSDDEFLHGWGPYPVAGQESAGFTGGWVSGYRYFPEQNMSIIYLSNGLAHYPVHNRIINRIAGMVDPDLKDESAIGNDYVADLFIGNLEAPLADFAEWRKMHPNTDVENSLNSVGYALMRSGRQARALSVFKLNVQEYPASWNVHDSLGEAYAAEGNTAKAVTCYEQSIALNPENQNGKDMLEKLQEQK